MGVGLETERAQGIFAAVGEGVNVADITRGNFGCGAERLDAIFVEDGGAGVYEGLDIVGRIFGGHGAVVVVFGAFFDIPVNAFERGAFLPEPPEIFAGFFAVGVCGGVEAVVEESGGEGLLFGLRVEREAIEFNVEPGDEERHELRFYFGVFGCEVFIVEEVADAVSGAFVDNHGAGAVKYAGAGRAHHVFGFFAFCGFPEADLGEVDESIVAATARVGGLGRADRDSGVALRHELSERRAFDADELIFFEGIDLADFVEHGDGIFLNHLLEHGFDFACAFVVVGDDEGVKAGVMHEL